MSPISSMWPASMNLKGASGLRIAMELPCTSGMSWSTCDLTRLRNIFAAGCSNPDGEGASSSSLRKFSVLLFILVPLLICYL